MQRAADENAQHKSFTGKLVRRHYKRGQPYVQLVFKGARGVQLALSRSPSIIQSLKVGQTYRIVGPQYETGTKSFIHEPQAVPMNLPSQSKKRWVIASAVTAFLIVLTGSVGIARHFAANNTVQAEANSSTRRTATITAISGVLADESTASSDPTAAVTPEPMPTPTRTTTGITSPPSQSPPLPAKQQPAAQEPLPANSTPDPAPTQPETPPPAEDPPITPPSEDEPPATP